MFKRLLVLVIFCCSCVVAKSHLDEEQISHYLEYNGIDLHEPASYENISLDRWRLISQELLHKNCMYFPVLLLPSLATPEEWVCALTLITTGVAFYAYSFTRPLGIWCIRTGFGIIGVASMNDFRDYARKKGWLSSEDWNIFNSVLEETAFNPKGAT